MFLTPALLVIISCLQRWCVTGRTSMPLMTCSRSEKRAIKLLKLGREVLYYWNITIEAGSASGSISMCGEPKLGTRCKRDPTTAIDEREIVSVAGRACPRHSRGKRAASKDAVAVVISCRRFIIARHPQ